ncbi:MAG: hypothetical protein ACYDCC_05035 [Actinomycetota bacterium]
MTKRVTAYVALGTIGLSLLLGPKARGYEPAFIGLGRLSRTFEERFAGESEYRSSTLDIGPMPVKSPTVPTAPLQFTGSDGQVITVTRIHRFLVAMDSPLAQFSSEIVSAGVHYQVDPRVVVAISGVESTFGRYQFGHNAWGWGRLTWSSWPAAIDSYTRLLGTAYRSLRTGRFSAASRTYCPPCGDSWGVRALEIFIRI